MSSYICTCSNLSASRVPSSSCLGVASDRPALEPPRPRPRNPLNEPLFLEPRKYGRDLVFNRLAIPGQNTKGKKARLSFDRRVQTRSTVTGASVTRLVTRATRKAFSVHQPECLVVQCPYK